MSASVKRPGYMLRACVAWAILNAVMIFTLAALIFVMPNDQRSQWYIWYAMIVAVVVSEWIIMGETIAPIIKDWIKQEEYVRDGEKPSWDRSPK